MSMVWSILSLRRLSFEDRGQHICGRGGIGRRARFRSVWANPPWRFESSRPHQLTNDWLINDGNVIYGPFCIFGICNVALITLAKSGTVVLFNEGIKGRPVSLLPESYIVLVPKSSIVPTLSGPSNSADIEMNLVVGVHGPVRTTYIVVDDQ